MLKDWSLRDRGLKVKAVAGKRWSRSPPRNAVASPFPPPVSSNSAGDGFDFMLQTARTRPRKSDGSPPQMLGMAAKDPRLVRSVPTVWNDVPEYHSDVDWEKAGTLGVPSGTSTRRSRRLSAAPM